MTDHKSKWLTAALLLAAGPVMATPVNVSGANGEATLQQILDALVVSGTAPDANSGQYGLDELWQHTNSGNASATLIVEIAGFRFGNVIGIYDPSDTSDRVMLFSGPESTGSRAAIVRNFDGANYAFSVVDLDSPALLSQIMTSPASFGFFLDTPEQNTVYSQSAPNADGADHMVAYQGSGQTIDLPTVGALQWNGNGFILAWEDLLSSGWDYDYNDFVMMVNP